MEKKRKIVFHVEQLQEMFEKPTLATAVILALREHPDMTTAEAFCYARGSLKQLELFNKKVDSGEIVVPHNLHEAEENRKHFEEIYDLRKNDKIKREKASQDVETA